MKSSLSVSGFAVVATLFVVADVAVVKAQTTSVLCGPKGFSLAGSSTVLPVAEAWVEDYQKACPGLDISVAGGGSGRGASRVCAVDDNLSEVDIGNMSREWKTTEAQVEPDGFTYTCTGSDRAVLQVDVAIDGLTIAIQRGGTASKCIATLPGKGLTVQQLRWIYSDYSDTELQATGTWDATSIANLNSNPQDKLWSELSGSPECPNTPIKISGADNKSGTHDYFLEATQFVEDVEYFDEDREGTEGYVNSEVDEDIVQHLLTNDDAIGYFGYAYFFENQEGLEAIAIQNSDDIFVAPGPATIQDGSYNPYGRRIYMNLYINEETLVNTRPFLEFGMSDAGVRIVSQRTGYVPIPEWERVLMLSRIEARGGVDLDEIDCGPAGSFSIAGSSTVFPVVQTWAGLYTGACRSKSISVEGGGSSAGARRVCDAGGVAVDIGDMSRQWKTTEATTTNGWKYDCVHGDTSRSVIQLDVAIDGLSVAVKRDGVAATCLEKLGGLTLDQLRWIYSSYSIDELKSSGWNQNSVPFLDTSSSTRSWSELDQDCVDTPILIAGADSESGTYEYFKETVLPQFEDDDNAETFQSDRIGGYFNSDVDEDVVGHLLSNDDAIGYFGFAYVFRNSDRLVAAKIQNSAGDFITPSPDAIEDGTYNPLARRIYCNVLEDSTVLSLVRPFFEFGFSEAGTAAMEDASGYSPVPDWEKYVMLSRVGAESGVDANEVTCGPSNGEITIAGSSTVFPVAQLWAGIYDLYCDVRITVEGGGSSVGASRVCANGVRPGTPVDIGDMSREWKPDEATVVSDNELLYDCVGTSRSVIQVQVAIDGLTVVAQLDGAGAGCIAAMGGLTKDQLRWIYSSYTSAQLSNSGWDRNSVPKNDNIDTTHLWSELSNDSACPAIEIRIAGADNLSGTYEYFLETILTDYEKGETFDMTRPEGYFNSERDEVLVNYVNANADAIAYFGYAYYFTNQDNLYAAPIQNPSTMEFVEPNESTVGNGDYSPLARPIYMNLWDDAATLKDTEPFIVFGFSSVGDRLVGTTGYVQALETTQATALSTISAQASRGGDGPNIGAIVGGVVGGIVALVIVCIVVVITRRNRDSDKTPFTDGSAVNGDGASPGESEAPVV